MTVTDPNDNNKHKPGLQVLVDLVVEFGKPGALLTAIPTFENWFKS